MKKRWYLLSNPASSTSAPEHPGTNRREAGAFKRLAERYRSLQRKLADLLHRRHDDYGQLTAIAQEIAHLRRAIAAEVRRLRLARRPWRRRQTTAAPAH